MAALAID